AGVAEEGLDTHGSIEEGGGVGEEGLGTHGSIEEGGGVGEEGLGTHGSICDAAGNGVEGSVARGSVGDGGGCKIAGAGAEEDVSTDSVKNGEPADGDDTCIGAGCVGKEKASCQAQTTIYVLIAVAALSD